MSRQKCHISFRSFNTRHRCYWQHKQTKSLFIDVKRQTQSKTFDVLIALLCACACCCCKWQSSLLLLRSMVFWVLWHFLHFRLRSHLTQPNTEFG